jgi:hypothetical protein
LTHIFIRYRRPSQMNGNDPLKFGVTHESSQPRRADCLLFDTAPPTSIFRIAFCSP